MKDRIVVNKSVWKSIIRILFLIFMCSVMAHKRVNTFDAIFSRISFIVFIGCFILYVLKSNTLKIYRKGFFISEAILVFLYLISYVWAKDKNLLLDMGIINSFIQILGVSLVIEVTTDNIEDCKSYLKIYLLSIVYMTTFLVLSTPVDAWGTLRVGEEIGLNPNSIGVRCAVAFLIAIYLASEKTRFSKIYYALSTIFVVVALYSGSRKSFLILTVGFAIYFVAKERGAKSLLRFFIVSGAIITLLYFVITNDELYHILGKRIERAFDFWILGRNDVIDTSSVERKFYIKYAVSMFLNSPLVGYGGNGFVAEMKKIRYQHVAYSHCNYVELLATLGSVGFALYYRIQIRMVNVVMKLIKKYDSQTRSIVCLAFSLLVSNLLIEYFIVSYYSVSMQILLIILFNLIHHLRIERGIQRCEYTIQNN